MQPHSQNNRHQVTKHLITIKIATPTAQSSVDTSSSSTWPHSPPDAIISKDASPSIGKAATGSPLVREILESCGKEILESASDQFLDLAIGVRLQTISARELVKLFANAKRLGYQETDIIDNEDGVRHVQEANAGSPSKPNGIETPKPRATIAGPCLSPQLRLNHLLSKSLGSQTVRTQLRSGETSLSRRTHTSMLLIPKGQLFPRKRVVTAFGAYRVLRVYRMGCQQLGLLGNREKGSAQRPDRKRGSQLMLGGLAVS